MTIRDLLEEKGYTVYRLSKESGISKTTLFDIFSGKSNLLDCRFKSVIKIAKVLNVSLDDLANLEPILYNPAYEENLPSFLKDDINFLKDKRNMKNSLFDCYLDEANSNINVCEVEDLISKEQADYLRKKYLK